MLKRAPARQLAGTFVRLLTCGSMAQVFQLAGEVRTAALTFDVVVSSGFTFLRDMNGALILDVNGTPIPVFA